MSSLAQIMGGSSVVPGTYIETINTISPDGSGNFTISAGSGITITPETNGIEISSTSSGVTIDTPDNSSSVTGSTLTFTALAGADNSGSSVRLTGSGTTVTLNVTDANDNTLIGLLSGNASVSGIGNTALGWQALKLLSSGHGNTAVGSLALENITTGVVNIAVGTSAGADYTGAESSNIVINNFGTPGESNVIRIGTQGSGNAEQDACYIAGITGVNVGSVANVVSIATGTGQLGTTAITAGTGISVTPGANTITIASTGSGAITIDGDTGSATGSTITLTALNGDNNCGPTVTFSASGSTVTLNVTDAFDNTAIGNGAGAQGIGGAENTVLGQGAFAGTNTGSSNTILGSGAGSSYNAAESSNIVIGSGNGGISGESTTLHLGDGGGSPLTASFIGGINGITVSDADQMVIINASNQLGAIAAGTTGQVLTSNGPGVNPSWQASGSAGTAVSFNAYLSTTQTDVTGDGTVYQPIFDAVLFNNDSGYDASTGIFTAPVTGDYILETTVQIGFGGSVSNILSIITTSTTYSLPNSYYGSGNNIAEGGAVIAAMTAGDTAYVTIAATTSLSTKNVPVNGSSSPVITYFCGALLASTGGGGVTIDTPDNSSSVSGSTLTFTALAGADNSGSSVTLTGSGTTVTLNVTDANDNTIVGNSSGNNSITGIRNTGIGELNFVSLTSGNYNAALGQNCFVNLQNGSSNCAVGQNILAAATSGSFNVAIGNATLTSITTGNYNSAFGVQAGQNYTSSESSNISIGYLTGGTVGESNVLRIGNGTGTSTGNINAAFIAGIEGITVADADQMVVIDASGQLGAIAAGTTGQVLTSNGPGVNPSWQAGGAGGTAVSFNAYLSTTQTDVTGDGTVYQPIFDAVLFNNDSGYDASTGVFTAPVTGDYLFQAAVVPTNYGITNNFFLVTTSNTFAFPLYIVPSSGYGGTSWAGSVIVSMSAGDTAYITLTVTLPSPAKTVNLNGGSSPILTYFSGALLASTGGGGGVSSITTDDANSVTGAITLSTTNLGKTFTSTSSGTTIELNAVDGSNNVVLGSANAAGGYSVAVGANAIAAGNISVAIGYNPAAHNAGSISIGYNSEITGGTGGVAVGDGSFIYGSYGIAIGSNVGSSAEGDNNILLNSPGGTETNTLRIGSATGTGTQQLNAAYVCGVQTIVVAGTPVLVSSGDQLGVATSSRKYKNDIQDMADSSSFISQLRPVTYVINKDSAPGLANATDERQYGLIAEEVVQVMPSLVNFDSTGAPQSVKYEHLPQILLNELLKSNKRIAALEAKLGVTNV